MEDGLNTSMGSIHPVTTFFLFAHTFFRTRGFDISEGVELETEYNNFDALNLPRTHPARDQQDTFWIRGKENLLLRTQTSSIQSRYMRENPLPVRVIAPGRVYRQEATDATHEFQFHQIEGLVVDTHTSLAQLRSILVEFLQEYFNDDSITLRFRPGYFPFVEPGVEIDVSCSLCSKDGCSVCKKSGWIEVLGAGMVHPNVLRSADLDPEGLRGFAFGLSPERLLMIKYGIDDIRWFHSADLRFLTQFKV